MTLTDLSLVGMLKQLGAIVFDLPGIGDILNGIFITMRGFSFFVFLPLNVFGLSPGPLLLQVGEFIILIVIFKKLFESWKTAAAVSVGLFVLGIMGGIA